MRRAIQVGFNPCNTMKLMRTIAVLFLAFGVCFSSLAQKDFTKDAELAFKSEAYSDAIPLYKKAYTKEKDSKKKGEILFNIAECFRHIQDPKQAEVWYQKSIKFNHPDPLANLYLADVIKSQGRYDEAIVEYQKYKAKNPGDPRGDVGIKSCEMASKWEEEKDKSKYKVENEVLLNSKQFDFSPTFADKKNNALIFTSSRQGAAGGGEDGITGQSFTDLFYSVRDKRGKWSVPEPLNSTINTAGNEGSAALNKRMNYIYFTRCESENKKELVCHIYGAKKQGRLWAEPAIIEFEDDSLAKVHMGHPSIAKDDMTMFFATDALGGQGGKDIFYTTYNKKSKKWSIPVNLGPEINTPGNEMFPFIRPDGTLFFSSDGHLGMGGLDIFSAASTGKNTWGNPENMKSPINSPANDFGIIFEGNKNRGYLTSDRKDSRGADDIYQFYQPPIIYILQGTVTDVETKTPLTGAKVTLVGTDGSSVETVTDELGFFIFDKKEGSTDRYLSENTAYTMEVSKEGDDPGYLNAKGQETTVSVEKSTTFVHDFALQPFSTEIEFPKVLYDLGKWELQVNDSVNSKDSLNYLYQTLVDNPTIVIELSAHTDSRGRDASNQTLSKKRAQSCVDYLIEKGIPADRMQAVGYGESSLKISDEAIAKLPTVQEREAAHQENRRTVFKVLRNDYVAAPTTPAEGAEGESGDQ